MSNRMRFATADDLPPHLREQVREKLVNAPRGTDPILAAALKQPPAASNGRSEFQEQRDFFKSLDELVEQDGRYRLAVARTYAIANGGTGRTKAEGGRLKVTGVRVGVADIHVALPVGIFHGCIIEMKSCTGYPSREQRKWLNESVDLGYAAACCRGAREALAVWRAYVDPSL